MWYPFKKKKSLTNSLKTSVGHPKSNINSISVPYNSWTKALLMDTNNLDADNAFELYRRNSSVGTAVDMIAAPIETLELIVVDKVSGERYEGGDVAKLMNLLDQPNGFNTKAEFLGNMARNYLITGNSYLSIFGNYKKTPLQIYSINPTLILIDIDHEDNFASRYTIYNGVGKDVYARKSAKAGQITRFINKNGYREFYHIARYDAGNLDSRGQSPMNQIFLEIKQQIAGRVHNYKLLDNGGKLSYIITFQDETPATPDMEIDRRTEVTNNLAGVGNAGNIAVLSSTDGIKVESLAEKNIDMDYFNLDSIATKAIFNRYMVPLPLISNDASTLNNVSNFIPFFFQQTVLPTADVLLDNMSKVLCPRFGIDASKYKITYDRNKIDVMSEFQLKQILTRKKIDAETPNELRSYMNNRGPIGGGDDLLINGATIRLTDIEEVVANGKSNEERNNDDTE